MKGVLLDSHAFYWLASQAALSDDAFAAIAKSQAAGRLFVSAITAWELAVATQKRRDPPKIDAPMSKWVAFALHATSATLIPIHQKIAIEAAEVPLATGHKDPGDCYLIATARVRKIPIVTRDAVMLKLATHGYLDVIVC